MNAISKAPSRLAGLLDRPLFDDPLSRALDRVGVVDVGSNSVRLVIFDGAARSPAYFFNEKILSGLGRNMSETGCLHPEGRARALAALKRFSLLASGMDLHSLTVVATAAIREAADGESFRAEVEAETGLVMHVIDGAEEARLSAQGVLLGWPGAEGLVCDIGGSSMELAQISGGAVGQRLTTPLGPFRLAGIPGGKAGLRKRTDAEIARAREVIDARPERLFLVGGSWRALARLDMERRNYPLTVLHEYEMTPKGIRKTIEWLETQDLKRLRDRTGISPERVALLPVATQVLLSLLRAFAPRNVHVSAYGIREGLLYEQMPDALRRRDPLIEACRLSEATSARLPGMGRKLFDFVMPLYRSAPAARLRLIRAACLLHDVNWRAHPDYRAEACFDSVTRASLSALSHRERIFLGLALMYRYKNSVKGLRLAPMTELLDEREITDAQVLGRALRFGAMFSMTGPETAGRLKLYPKKKVLELILRPDTADLFGEVAAARFEALVKALGVTGSVITGVRPRSGGN
jgi:exopolyphosphatase / guanosine-5'-triphosphate,3'-diphosphate pyrophosphatase